MRIKQDQRAVSNIIVIVLGLVIVTIIVSNVFLWNYEMNQLDWERMHEDLEIVDVAPITGSSWSVAQSEYSVDIGEHVNGSYVDTQTIDSQCESFTEGLNWWNTNYSCRRQITIANNSTSTLDSNYTVNVLIDTASLVSDGKMLSDGKDLRIVFSNESSWKELDRDVIDMNTSSTQVWFKTQVDISGSGTDDDYYTYYGNPSATNPPANKSDVYLWFDDFSRPDNPDITTEVSYNVKTEGGTWSIESSKLKNVGDAGDPNKLIITALDNVNTGIDMLVTINVASFAGGDRSRMGLSCCMDSDPSRGSGYCGLFHEDTSSLDLLNDLRSWGTKGTYSWSLNTWYFMRFRVVDPASRLGKVKVWQVGATEPSTWTDGNFGSGTARSYGEIGFAGSRNTDTTYFDDILIRCISDPEPSTAVSPEENQGDNRLCLDNTFVIDLSTYPLACLQTVEIQLRYRSDDAGEKWHLKAYDWSSSIYSDVGFNVTTGHLPTTDWDNYTVNLTDKWNSYVKEDGTIYVRIVDQDVDEIQTNVDVDFLGVRAMINGVRFTFKNKGSLTTHLVSLWIINSTSHQHHDIDLIINSGQTLTHTRFDISLPNGEYLVKVVTERGNMATHSES